MRILRRWSPPACGRFNRIAMSISPTSNPSFVMPWRLAWLAAAVADRLLADGSRCARRRGGHAAKRGLSAEQVPILVARNRAGQTTDFILKTGNKQGLIAVLPLAIADDAVLCTDGSAMLARAARDLGIEHHGLNTLRGERKRGVWHIQNVNGYHSRFKGRMARFKGVATSYLPNYLGWFRALDRNAQSGAKATSLLALAISA